MCRECVKVFLHITDNSCSCTQQTVDEEHVKRKLMDSYPLTDSFVGQKYKDPIEGS